MESAERTVFKIWPALDRRHQPGASPIRAVAVDGSASKLYLGLEDGLLEEHTLVEAAGAVGCSLSARKHVSKRALVAIAHLGTAGCLTVLTDDGSVHLLDCESLKAQLLPLRHVVALCVDQRRGHPPRLALALKPSKRVTRVEVYEPPAAGEGWGRRTALAHTDVPEGSAVKGLAWVGPHLVLCAGLKYIMVAPGQQGGQWRELFEVPQDLAYSPVMTQPIPQLAQAMLVVGPAGIVVDASGSPVGSALRLDGLATPRALAASSGYVLAACEDAVHVFDCASGAEVQLLQYGPGMRPAPGQLMFAASSAPGTAPPAGGSTADGCVVLAGRSVAWACLPVSPEEQAAELLGRRDYGDAMALIEGGLRQGARWAAVASAQAALCMLHDCLFEEAALALERCSPEVFQPAELFPLFPAHTKPWLAQVPTDKRYWGLHAPLQNLDLLIARRLSRLSAASPSRSDAQGGAEGRTNGTGSPQQQQHQLSVRNGSASQEHSTGDGPEEQRRTAAQQQQQQVWASRPGEGGGAEAQDVEQLGRRARHSLVQYLFQARMREGVACLEGVDSLILHLLIDLGAVREVAAFAAVPNSAAAEAVAARLQSKGWHHALATLWAARGDAESALHIWRQLVEGELAAAQDPVVRAAERREALESAAALLSDPATSPDASALAALPWLLAASPPTALEVLTSRPLAPHAVLAVLPSDSDARWQYLDHLVQCMARGAPTPGPLSSAGGGSGGGGSGGGSEAGSRPSSAASTVQPRWLWDLSAQDRAAIHTELATQLVGAILRLQPALRSPLSPPQRPPSRPLSRRTSRAGAAGGGADGPSRSGSVGLGRRASLPAGPGTAALVSRGMAAAEARAAGEAWEGVHALRLRLQRHLEESAEYDRAAALAAMAGTGLHEELVVLHCQLGDHLSALRVLALTLRDIGAAEAYAAAHLPPSEYRTLLQLVLHPGPGIEPLYEDACYLITALGDHLDPMDVVQALPPSMPLATAAAIIAPILRDRTHRRRQGEVARSLHRARLAAARGERADAEAGRVVVDDERACPGCHLRIGGKVFVVLQEGEAAGGAAGPAGQGLPSPRQQQQQQPPGRQADRRQPRLPGGELRVVCYNCYRRLAGAGAGQQGEAPGGRRT